MSITCPTCGFDENPDKSEFCEACGSELGAATATNSAESLEPDNFVTDDFKTQQPDPYNFVTDDFKTQQPEPEPIYKPTVVVAPEEEPEPFPTPNFSVNTGKLIAKQANTPVAEFSLDGNHAVIGRFDSDTGPVDIDLEGFPGEDTISRNHAEIYYEGNQWKIQDLGSTNGVFIKRSNQARFDARIMRPEVIESGDEIAIAKIRFLFQSP